MVYVARILKTRGNRGEVVLETSPDFREGDLRKGQTVFLKSEKNRLQKEITGIRLIHGNPVVSFFGCNTINDAYRLIGYELFLPGDSPLSGREEDYSGFLVCDPEGTCLGTVSELIWGKKQSMLVIRGETGEILIPFTEEIIMSVDRESKKIVADLPPGLLELNK